tara:strand:- start:1508 stop:1771 length:264 start_codon:yes stop_codon:yes gene_type:complete
MSTITTTAKTVSIAYPTGGAVRFPAQVPGIAVSTVDAIANCLKYFTASDIRDYVRESIEESVDVNATPAQVNYHVVAWMAGAGDWSE